MNYLIRDSEGEQQGPIGQQTLKEWVKEGKIKSTDKVRNTLLDKWENAEKVNCLKPVFKTIIDVDENKKQDSFFSKVKQAIGKSASDKMKKHSTEARGTFIYTPSPMTTRLFAFIMDLMLIFAFIMVLCGFGAYMVNSGKDINSIFNMCFFLFYTLTTLYFAWTLGFKAQTLGQHFWGIMIVKKKKGEPVFLGRAYVYTIGLMLFWWLTPIIIFINPGKRSIQEILTGTRIICTRNRSKY